VSGRKPINTRKIKGEEQVEKELNVCGSSGRLWAKRVVFAGKTGEDTGKHSIH